MEPDLVSLFLKLISVPSPSGRELNVGKVIKLYLKNKGISAYFDKTGRVNGSNSGNLIAEVKGLPNLPTILLVTHMDTVEDGVAVVEPVLTRGVIKSDGRTILGADNKASIAALLESLQEVKKWKNKPTIIAVFTTQEEKGQMGVSLLKLKQKIDYTFNIDGQGAIGGFSYKSLGQLPFKIYIHGKKAHAATNPEKGKHAILAASLFISKLKLGKNNTGETVNIGKISGGLASNVIPDFVELEGEVRSFDEVGLITKLAKVKSTLEAACDKTGCSYQVITNRVDQVPPFNTSTSSKIINIAKKATKNLILPFALSVGSFTCEANYLSKMGYDVLNVCRGGKNAHANNESIKVEELINLKKLIIELVNQSQYV